MRTIFKYELDRPFTRLDLPRGSKVLNVDLQHGHPYAWVMHEREALSGGHRADVEVMIAPTGGDMPTEYGDYVSTYFEHGGMYVWHAFVRYLGARNE
ncbi:DUF7352 domain-containing protein [Paraburkholderia sp. MM6662-R1]|uniref:DUF7352 domain-containing protein n=1 Tax=Paraburkholderia sp. MM6662-R1 TaxID=2991066 RepID=UPI003D1F8D20